MIRKYKQVDQNRTRNKKVTLRMTVKEQEHLKALSVKLNLGQVDLIIKALKQYERLLTEED